MKSRVTEPYTRHDTSRICQGDILRDVTFFIVRGDEIIELFFEYMIVLSQDCDLEQGLKSLENRNVSEIKQDNQFLHSILLVPAFLANKLREGEHLKEMGITQARINSSRWKVIGVNNNPRYHSLKSYPALQVPDLVVDFKAFYTLGVEMLTSVYKNVYLATISELFREDLSRRFTNYLSRIALPEIKS